jgi:hypothetical protein
MKDYQKPLSLAYTLETLTHAAALKEREFSVTEEFEREITVFLLRYLKCELTS